MSMEDTPIVNCEHGRSIQADLVMKSNLSSCNFILTLVAGNSYGKLCYALCMVDINFYEISINPIYVKC